jgi:hypothetical protein
VRIGSLLVGVLSGELSEQALLRGVEILTGPQRVWTWVLLRLGYLGDPAFAKILYSMAPVNAGELVYHISRDLLYFSRDGFPLERVSVADLEVRASLEDDLPEYVQGILGSTPSSEALFVLIRTVTPAGVVDAEDLKRAVVNQTWVGCRSLPPHLAQRKIELRVGAQRLVVKPLTREPIINFEFGQAYVAAFSGGGEAEGILIRLYGIDGSSNFLRLDSQGFLDAIGFPEEEAYGFEIKIPLEFDAIVPSCRGGVDEVLEAVRANSQVHDLLRGPVKTAVTAAMTRSRERLERRRSDLMGRKRIYTKEGQALEFLMPVPKNETELLLLVAKLEGRLREMFGEFQVLEHTAQLGIDGLIRFRPKVDAPVEESATVEYELELPTFFRHNHPIRQTQYIICWTLGGLVDGTIRFGAGGIRQNGKMTAQMRPTDWMKVISFGDHLIRVLPLESLPGIVVAA